MKLKLFGFLLILLIPTELFAYQALENPKSSLSTLTISWNDHYEALELKTKFITNALRIEKEDYNLDVFYGVTLFTQAPDDLTGHYAVHDLIGIIGARINYKINSTYKLQISPLYHESSHYADGLLKTPRRDKDQKDEFTENELENISNDCAIIDLEFTPNNKFNLLGGGGYYYNTTSGRRINYFLHLAPEYNFWKDFYLATDLSYISENVGNTFGINSFLGYRFENVSIGIHFERQRGLGRDFQNMQSKYGVKLVYTP